MKSHEAWVARYNGTANGYDEAKSVAVDNSGNVHVAGTILRSKTLNDYATIKYDLVGQQTQRDIIKRRGKLQSADACSSHFSS